MNILQYYPESQKRNTTAINLMIFELSVGGHYPEYISHIIYFWNEYQIKGHLDVVVSPLFLQQHGDVVGLIKELNLTNVKFTAITSTESDVLKPFNTGIDRNIRAWQEFGLMRKYANKLKCDRVFIPYIDNLQIPIVLNRLRGITYSGIYFRPSFHYQQVFQYKLTFRDRLQQWREKLTLSLLLRDPNLKTLFCLDSLAIEHINRLNNEQKAIYISDPVKIKVNSLSNVEQLKSNLKIESSRQICLLFGAMGKRKGLDKLLEAVVLLPRDLCRKLCILLVGKMSADLKEKYLNTIEQLSSNLSVQIIIIDRYIPEEQIQSYFQLTDVVLAPYQRHIGMSGIINRAAIARKPVLASNYGLMGEMTRRYRLGLTVDSTKAIEIAAGLTELLTKSPDIYCDFNLMEQYAAQNTPEQFANTIFKQILN